MNSSMQQITNKQFSKITFSLISGMKIWILIVGNIPQIPIKYANQNNNFETFNRHESWKFLFLSAHPKVSKDCEKVLLPEF